MKHISLAIILFFSGTCRLNAQQADDIYRKSIDEFVEGYNTQDFGKMRAQMSGVLKLVFSEKKIKQVYGTQYELLGRTRIDRIIKRPEQGFLIELKYERDTTEVQKLGLAFTDKGKIIGLSNPSFKFLFPKNNNAGNFNENTAKAAIDSLANLKFNAANFNGCVLVLKDKKPFYQKCLGYSDMENKTALNENTLFDLASLSKSFTAMAIMKLAEQGKLKYDQYVEEFFPDFPYRNITIENLLIHTSGLPDYMDMFETHWDKSRIAGNDDVMAYLKKYKPKTGFKPGREYEYSNTGYVVLAAVIEKISGKSFSDYVAENIFKPLEMDESKVYNTKYTGKEIVNNYAKGYSFSRNENKFLPVTKVPELDYYLYLDGIAGDGAVNSTINDLVKWDNALREYRIVKKESFDAALLPHKTGNGEISEYGYGWELQTNDKYEKLIYHSGNWGGNINFILHFLDKDLTVVVLSNNEYFNAPKFAYKVAEIMNK